MHIHERIKKERKKSGLTPGEIASTLGVPRTTYLYWETVTPDIEKIKSVAKALGKDENYFFQKFDEESDENDESNVNMVKEDSVSYDLRAKTVDGQILYVQAKDLTASYERLIDEKERIIAIIKDQAEKAEKDKDRLFKALEDAQKTINEVLKPMATSLKEIPPVLDSIVRNSAEHDKEIMKALDHLVGNAPGTLEKESGKRILKGAMEHQKKGKAGAGT